MKLTPRRARRQSRPAPAQHHDPEASHASSWMPFVLPGFITVLTFIAFSPVLQNGFVNWDDEAVLLDNPHYRGLSWTHLRWMFTTFHMSVYRPIAWITMGLDYLIWGMEPFGYHLTTVLFHCANAVLFYFVAMRLLRLAMPAAAQSKLALPTAAGFAALFFALHPLRVEPVAWESGEDNLVAGFFFMLTLLCYLRAAAIRETVLRRWTWMGGAWVCYALSILSKALTVPLPLALLVLDIYPLKRLRADPRSWTESSARPVLWEKIPFLLFAVPVAVVAVLAKQSTGAVASPAAVGWIPRTMQSLYGLAFYPGKTIAPWGLSPLYERPIPFNPWDWPFLLSAVVVLVATGCFVAARRLWPAGLVAWVCYGAILLPSLGLITYGPQMVGDRYSYFSCLSWAVLAGAGMLYLWKLRAAARITAPVFLVMNGLACILLTGFGALTWKQTQIWHDSEKLWRHALSIDPRSSFAHNNLGLTLAKRGALDEAIDHFRRAVEVDPVFVEAYTNLGNFLAQRGSPHEAISQLRHALQIDPTFANAHNTLGNILADNGALEESLQHFRKALETNPNSAITHYNFGRALAKRGDVPGAISQYRQALQIDSGDADIHNNLGLLLLGQGDVDQAIEQFREAVRVDPQYAKGYFNLGKVYLKQNRLDPAVTNFHQALQIEPGVAEVHENLGQALALQGKKVEAAEHFTAALQILKSQRPLP